MKSIIVFGLYFAGIMLLFCTTFLALCLLPSGDKEPTERENREAGKD
jgi:hypothetical protein